MSKSAVRRETGVPNSGADQYVEEVMGGPVTQRASRKQNQDGPVPLSIGKTNGSGRSRARQDAMEEQLDTDVLPENSDGDDDEWVPRRYSRAEVTRRLAEQNTRSAQTAPERRTTGNPLPRRRTDDLPKPRQRRHLHGWAALLVGAFALIFLYLVIGWIYSVWIGISNRLSYGPTPTTYLEAVVGDHDGPGHPTTFVAMNEHGTIVIQVAPGGDFSKSSTYVLSAQTFHGWGNPGDVVVTLTLAGNGPAPNILVRLQGDPDLGHFYQRPTVSFVLLNGHPGFRVGPME